ncbi:MAG: 4Fe-4S dicluster domain-containing protein [Phascolarctobacterium sp.]|nr:4Fe-4S dicluster domain-containing protein [Phascolarctobacterium sp.]
MEFNNKELTNQLLRLADTDVSRCVQCGRCSATCPMGDKMDLLPSRMVWELINGNGEEMLAARSPWICLSCMACQQRCPRGVSPCAVMEAVRLLVIRQQGGNKLTAEAQEKYPADMPQQALVAAFRKYHK